MTNIRITAFKWVPPVLHGLIRDLRVRWALEEAGLPYKEKLLNFGEQNSPEHRTVQPFGQVPVYEEDAHECLAPRRRGRRPTHHRRLSRGLIRCLAGS